MDRLAEYKNKRDFAKTNEPLGDSTPNEPGNRFCVQKHDATRLHFDLRLEIDGVLKSWAIPKGPSLDHAEKRLAVQTEDHPIEYLTFEGVIPKGEYGAGPMMLWDIGTYTIIGDLEKSLAKGDIKIMFSGHRLKGKWVLFKIKPREGEPDKNWLMVKEEDKLNHPDFDLAEDRLTSIATGRTMEQILAGFQPDPLPKSMSPQLATLAEKPPTGNQWIHEIKFDGYRIMARIENGVVTLVSRSGLDWTPQFAKIAEQLQKLDCANAWVDGEVVILNDQGISDFNALQNYVKGQKGNIHYFAFDLPFCNGQNLVRKPLIERKERLRDLLYSNPEIKFSEHITGQGQAFFDQVCTTELEGMISKQADSTYTQRRSPSWLKVKCLQRQEFVIGGFTEPEGTRTAFGAILVGHYEGNQLVFDGRVGTGFDEKTLESLHAEFKPLITKTSPFNPGPTLIEAKGATFIQPSLVAEVEFAAWTAEDRLRHPVFKGLRKDKPAQSILKDKPPLRVSGEGVGGEVKLNITHPDKILEPEHQIQKVELARAYQILAPWILPYLQDRPLSLVRCPQGTQGETFFQKNYQDSLPKSVLPLPMGESTGIGVDSSEGLLALAQLYVVEIHPWGSQLRSLEQPDTLTFDLDPGPELDWIDVVAMAKELRDVLGQIGLQSWVKTSGGKGLHICVPIQPDLEWDDIKNFCHGVALLMERKNPKRALATISKAKRTNKIFIDYLRNGRGATSVAAYSPRARTGIPISMPITWDELEFIEGPAFVKLRSLSDYLAKRSHDPWADFLNTPQDLARIIR